MDDPSFLASEYPETRAETAHFRIIPVPLEKSVSYAGGTRFGPSAILQASQQLEAWEDGLAPGELGISTSRAIDCSSDIETVLQRIKNEVASSLAKGSVPVLLGGEHTVSIGALRAFAESMDCLPGVVQIDAHADLRPSYEGNPFSHASVMFRLVSDLGCRLVQFGVREYSREEAEIRKHFAIIHHDACELADFGLPDPILPEDFPENIYLSFDLDGLDCSLMPATGTPSPGGLFWHEARRLLTRISQSRRIIGMDVVELAPHAALHSCDFTAAKLVHLMMSRALFSEQR